ncbi:DUF6093 family protein [Pseudarthrobacter polychromogenes]|uniref:Uncharacterized protein n=1 Tax=Pseudarthrobacter polychromogenes TaxID=1676 RepID=A0ABQ1XC23_9MICC|nr:DUF6093 family protein [Pseudarthrobacter polychromogenes]GGG83632.1 hypothetical protein GCM10011577_01350 [Pseudarthrobacter polychromogenes]
MPLPNTRVIPANWAEHHRGAATGTQTAVVEWFHRGAPEPWPLPDGWTGPEPFHQCTANVQQINTVTGALVADQPLQERKYLVSIPMDAPEIRAGEQDGDFCKVTASSDPLLIGRTLNATDVQHGALMWERDIVCTDTLTQN